jgi:hypothetical protein
VRAATALAILSIAAALLQVAALVVIACTVRAGKVLGAVSFLRLSILLCLSILWRVVWWDKR